MKELEALADGLVKLLRDSAEASRLRGERDDLLEKVDGLEAVIRNQALTIQGLNSLLSTAGRPVILYKNDLTQLFLSTVSASVGWELERRLEEVRRAEAA